MDIMTFRALVERVLNGKSEELQTRVKDKIEDTLRTLGREYLSDETVAIIAMVQELELEREKNEKFNR